MNISIDLSIYTKEKIQENIVLFNPYVPIEIIEDTKNEMVLRFEKVEEHKTYVKEFLNYLIVLQNK